MHDARAEAKRWLAAAREDLAYARHARCVMAAQTFAEAEGCGG